MSFRRALNLSAPKKGSVFDDLPGEGTKKTIVPPKREYNRLTGKLFIFANADSHGNARIETVLTGHERGVICIAFSPDGKLLATGSIDKTLRVWSVESMMCVYKFMEKSSYLGVAFSPDGKWLAAGNATGKVQLWSVSTNGAEIILEEKRYFDQAIWATSLTFSKDSRALASVSTLDTHDAKFHLWNLSNDPITIDRKDMPFMEHVAFSPTDDILACACDDNILLYNVLGNEFVRDQAGNVLFETLTPRYKVSSMAFSRNGNLLACGSRKEDSIVQLWEKNEDGVFISSSREMDGNYGIHFLDFAKDGETLFGCSTDRIKTWDLTGEKITLKHVIRCGVKCVALSPDSKTLAYGCLDRFHYLTLSNNLKTSDLEDASHLFSILIIPPSEKQKEGNAEGEQAKSTNFVYDLSTDVLRRIYSLLLQRYYSPW